MNLSTYLLLQMWMYSGHPWVQSRAQYYVSLWLSAGKSLTRCLCGLGSTIKTGSRVRMKEVIAQAYLNAGQEAPSFIKYHSTHTVATSWGDIKRNVTCRHMWSGDMVTVHCLPFLYFTGWKCCFIATHVLESAIRRLSDSHPQRRTLLALKRFATGIV